MSQDNMQISRIENEKAQHFSNFKSGVTWFFWLAAISVVNLIIRFTNPENTTRFAIGFSISKYLEENPVALFGNVAPKTVALVLSILLIGLIVLLGFVAYKRNKLAYIVGLVLYALDIIPAAMIGDLYAVIFHVIVVGFLVWGLIHLIKLEKLEAAYPDEEEPEVIVIGPDKP